MVPREYFPSNINFPPKPFCSLPASCPLQQGDASCEKMPLKAVLRGNSLENTPNSSDQQQPSRSEHDGSDDSGGSPVSAEFTELCTEDCHLITCADPTHEAANCTASGDTLVCPDPKDCNVVDKYVSVKKFTNNHLSLTFGHSCNIVQICTHILLSPKVTRAPIIGIIARQWNTERTRQMSFTQPIQMVKQASLTPLKSLKRAIHKTVYRRPIYSLATFRANCQNIRLTIPNSMSLARTRTQPLRRH